MSIELEILVVAVYNNNGILAVNRNLGMNFGESLKLNDDFQYKYTVIDTIILERRKLMAMLIIDNGSLKILINPRIARVNIKLELSVTKLLCHIFLIPFKPDAYILEIDWNGTAIKEIDINCFRLKELKSVLLNQDDIINANIEITIENGIIILNAVWIIFNIPAEFFCQNILLPL